MNKNYIKGRRAEYKAISMLEAEGYKCQRGAGSHSVDIIAWFTLGWNIQELPIYRFIEVKTGKLSASQKAEAINKFKSLSIPSSASVEVWWFTPRGKLKIYRVND